MESTSFYYGKFFDDCFKELKDTERSGRGVKMNIKTAELYATALRDGSKHIYEAVPRLLTLWLDCGEGMIGVDNTLAEYHKIITKTLIQLSLSLPFCVQSINRII